MGDALEAMVLDSAVRLNSDDPTAFGWPDSLIAAARARLIQRGLMEGDRPSDAGRHLRAAVEAETDMLAADPWETLTESRRTRALGVLCAAADRVGSLPRDHALDLGEIASS
jgi:hypothetical protein